MNPLKIFYFNETSEDREVLSAAFNDRQLEIIPLEDSESLPASNNGDLVICAIDLHAGMNWQDLRQIRIHFSSLPMLLVSAPCSSQLAFSAARNGVDALLEKPLDEIALLNTVRDLLAIEAEKDDGGKEQKRMEGLENELRLHTRHLEQKNLTLKEKTEELERKAISLGMANIDMLKVQEQLEVKNELMQQILSELSQSKDILQSIIDASPATIIMVDKNDRINVANKRVNEYFGLKQEEIIQLPYPLFLEKIKSCFASPEAFQENTERIQQILRGRMSNEIDVHEIYRYSIQMVSPTPRDILPINAPVVDKDGNELGAIWVINDITKMKEADALLRTMADASPIPFIISRLDDGKILYINQPLADLMGAPISELIGKKTPDFYSNPEDRSIIIDKIRKDGKLQGYEVPIKGYDGTETWMSFSLSITTLGGEQVLVGGLQDISEIKKNEESLRLYRKIFMNSNDSIAILSPQGVIQEINPAGVRLFGYPEEEVVGKTTEMFIGGDVFTNLLKQMPDHGNYSVRKELSVTTKEGENVFVELSAFPILDEDEAVIFRIGFVRDITERKTAEAALQKAHDELEQRVQERTAELARKNTALLESELKNTALLNAIPDLMFRLNKDGIYLDYKAPKESDLVLPREKVIGKHVSETLPPQLAEQTMANINKVLQSKETRILEYELPHDDHVHSFEARIVTSGPHEVLAIVRDITNRKKAEQALQKHQEELEQRVDERTAELASANQDLRETQSQLVQSEKMAALGMLVAGIAHEINTPVGAISSMHNTLVRAVDKLKTILEQQLPDGLESNRKLTTILKMLEDGNRVVASGSERVTTIVKRLRSFARLDEAELKSADIHEGIDDTLVLIHHEIKHGIEVKKEFGDDIPLISCYPGKLNQVLLNLLINAKQAMNGEGTITISTSHSDGNVRVAITDTGVGIPPENLRKIFDPGFTTKGVGVGTGLGLSIVFRIVREDHLGDIQVESEVGKGTTFTVSIPDNLDTLVEHT